MANFPLMEETHVDGHISLENLQHHLKPLLGGAPIDSTGIIQGELGIQVADDGRVWICLNGVSLLRFKPKVRVFRPLPPVEKKKKEGLLKKIVGGWD